MIRTCSDSDLIIYAHVLKILNAFANVNFALVYKTGAFTAMVDRFRVGESPLIPVFDLFLDILKMEGEAKIKNQQFWELMMSIIEAMF